MPSVNGVGSQDTALSLETQKRMQRRRDGTWTGGSCRGTLAKVSGTCVKGSTMWTLHSSTALLARPRDLRFQAFSRVVSLSSRLLPLRLTHDAA